MNTANINKLLTLLSKSQDASHDELTFLSNDLVNDKELLTKLSIQFDEHSEGIVINLAQQPILIYKTKADCIKHFQGNIENDIIVIEDKIIYNKTSVSIFFENLIYSTEN